MKFLRRTHAALAPVFLSAALAMTASAPAMADIHTETADAGGSLATAQSTMGMPTAIRGNLSGSAGGDGTDLYRIYLGAGNVFTATTAASAISYNNFDTTLFLFDATGRGLVANDDDASVGPQSTLSFTATASGYYFLGIAGNGLDAVSGNQSIFAGLAGSTGQMAPAPGAGALTGWNGYTSEGDAYEIALQVQAVPEPQTLALMLAGIAVCGTVARRRRQAR